MSLTKETKKYIEKNCKCDLNGKIVLITGANSGIGFKTAESMIYLGASVILACRNGQKASGARDKMLEDYPDADIRLVSLDMADFKSIDRFVAGLPDVDVFINNAGIFHHPGQKTSDGFEMVMGTNYLGVFYLSEKVMPILEQRGHDVVYINTISIIHKIAHINYKKFFTDKGAYARSKLCLARYTNYLAEKYSGTNIKVYMTHPGMAITPIAAHVFGRLYKFADIMPINSAEKSALSAAWLLSHNVPEGSVIGPNKFFGGWGYPELNRPCKRASKGIPKLIDFTRSTLETYGLGNASS